MVLLLKAPLRTIPYKSNQKMYVQKYGISSVTFENTSQHFILGILPSVVLIECLLLLQMLYHKLAHTVEKNMFLQHIFLFLLH